METVLFACTHNAGRSQMAAAFFNALADPQKAFALSAGTAPGTRVHPEVVSAMLEEGIDLSRNLPEKLSPLHKFRATMLITMGCGESCPFIPETPTEDWPLEDPKGQPIERVREIRNEIRGRVEKLLALNDWAK